ncbi:hypothetical protein FIBSPDRAFT_203731 [Athelia psychrophila]|uniref:Uncharacterized protein n=1 Tax=Athelia psychrophila TaxID=1759441 RepID=A0A165ZGE9_9AGAM|nr:hypothetical protein FIBSPDRAFT_203731 [Fibularhizoctonia sp. CBS 109695]
MVGQRVVGRNIHEGSETMRRWRRSRLSHSNTGSKFGLTAAGRWATYLIALICTCWVTRRPDLITTTEAALYSDIIWDSIWMIMW